MDGDWRSKMVPKFMITWGAWMYVSLYEPTRCTTEAWKNWLMELPSHSTWDLKNHSSQVKFQVTGKEGNIVPMCQKGRMKDPGNWSHLCAWQGHEQILLEALLRYMENMEVIWDSQNGSFKGKFYLTNRVTFYNGLVAVTCRTKGKLCVFLNMDVII